MWEWPLHSIIKAIADYHTAEGGTRLLPGQHEGKCEVVRWEFGLASAHSVLSTLCRSLRA